MSRAPFCGCEGEEGAWGGDTSPELCPEEKDKSQTPLKCCCAIRAVLYPNPQGAEEPRAGALWGERCCILGLNLPFFLVES